MVLGFAFVILLGAFLLSLPLAVKNGENSGFLTALFTAASATCVTGLVVVDTYTHWSLFGQIVILILIQIGGLGFMTMATMFSLVLRRKISLKERIFMAESINQYSLQGIVSLTKSILICTLCFEGAGAMLLSFRFVPKLGLVTGIYYGIFHSVAAFCNAGFDIMGRYGQFSSLTGFVDDPVVNLVIMSLIIIGGLGFAVLSDLYSARSFRKLHLHSKLVLSITGLLLAFGFIFFFIMEYNNPKTLSQLKPASKVMAAMFQSVTARTAGFNTIDLTGISTPSVLVTIILMFIGGSSGSTAGGIKTTTFGVIMFSAISAIKGRNDTEIFKKRLPHALVIRAFVITFFSVSLIMAATAILTISNDITLTEALFEATSAFGTVGLTLGITPRLSIIGKIAIIVTMFLGRVGILTTVLAIENKPSKSSQEYRYPKDSITVG